MTSVFKIQPTAQQYDWGKIGSQSRVAQLAHSSGLEGFTLDESKPYAEARYNPLLTESFLCQPDLL
jgi:mannose-6-phosphate isomerase